LIGIVTQVCLHALIGYEFTVFNVMGEAQGFNIFLKSAGDMLGVAPEAGPNEFVGDAPQHGMGLGQLPLRLVGGAERKGAVVVVVVIGRLVQNPLKKKDNFL
jgi:hypothetical protein